MHVGRPKVPHGFHVLILRTHLGLTQTEFGALLGINQPTVSTWENPLNRDEKLPAGIARRFLEIWDCFPTPPSEGFDEVISVLAASRGGTPAPCGPASRPGMRSVRLVPEEPVSADVPEIYWVHGDGSSTATRQPAEQDANAHRVSDPPAELKSEREVMRASLTLSAVLIVFSVWSRVRSRRSAPAIRWPGWGGRWATAAASIAVLLFPTGCFHAQRRGGEVVRAMPVQNRESWPTELSTWEVPSLWLEIAKGTQPVVGEQQKPLKPFKGQKKAPCASEKGEFEIDKLCWWKLDPAAPCPPDAVKHEGKCLVPVPEGPRTADRR